MARNPVVFSNGTLVSNAKVEIDGTIYDVTPAQYEGTTPLSAANLNQLQTNLYDYVDEEIENMTDVYSTNEIKTNKVWVDGKPIYRKVIDFGSLPSSTTAKNVAHNISNLDEFTLIYGIVKSSNNTLPIPYATTDANSNIRLSANLTNVSIGVGYDRSSESAKIVLEYTKTTD